MSISVPFRGFFIYSGSLPVNAGMRIAHLSLEMHQFRWAASWLQQRPRGGGGGPRCRQCMIRARHLLSAPLKRLCTSGSGGAEAAARGGAEMRWGSDMELLPLRLFSSRRFSVCPGTRLGKMAKVSSSSVMLHHMSENAFVFNILQYYSASFIQKFNDHFIINQ